MSSLIKYFVSWFHNRNRPVKKVAGAAAIGLIIAIFVVIERSVEGKCTVAEAIIILSAYPSFFGLSAAILAFLDS